MALEHPERAAGLEDLQTQGRQQLSLSLRTSLSAIRGAIVTALEDESYRSPAVSRETLLLIVSEVDKLWAKVNEIVGLAEDSGVVQPAGQPQLGGPHGAPMAQTLGLAPARTAPGRSAASGAPRPAVAPETGRAERAGPAGPARGPALWPGGRRGRAVIVDDETSMQTYLRRSLQEAGYEPFVASDPKQAVALIESAAPDVVLLDLHLGGTSGFDVLKAVRSTSKVPVIMLTVSDTDEDTVQALTLGADDFMTKPFSLPELLARIDAVLRRKAFPDMLRPKPDFVLHDLRIDFKQRQVLLRGQPLPLTPTEYKLLHELADRAGRMLTFDELLKSVWGAEYAGETGLVRVQVRNLRKKLGDDGESPKYILNQRGVGYRMVKPQ